MGAASVRKPRKLEECIRSTVVVLLKPECVICGLRMEKQFLQPWNDQDVCKPCIAELTQDANGDDYDN